MYDRDHRDTGKHHRKLSIPISEYEYRNSGEKCPEYRDKSTDKYDERECKYKWKCSTSMKKANHDQSDCREYCVDEGDDRLRLEYKPKSISYFFCDDCPFIIQKAKISIADLPEEFFYPFSIDDKEIREYQGDEKFRENNTSIGDVGNCIFPDRLKVV